VLELGDDVDFTGEPVGPHRGREFRAQDLERDLPVVLEVVGQVDGGHPAKTHLALDPVAPAQGSAQAVQCGGHERAISKSPTGLG
jgi:hypothetical protein